MKLSVSFHVLFFHPIYEETPSYSNRLRKAIGHEDKPETVTSDYQNGQKKVPEHSSPLSAHYHVVERVAGKRSHGGQSTFLKHFFPKDVEHDWSGEKDHDLITLYL